jgi:hypothetical protein
MRETEYFPRSRDCCACLGSWPGAGGHQQAPSAMPSGSTACLLLMALAELLFNTGDLRSALQAQAGKLVARVAAVFCMHTSQG